MSKVSKYYHSEVKINEYPFNEVDISCYDYNTLYQLYIQFNKSTNKIEKIDIANKLPKNIFPICRFCGKLIVNANFKLKLTKHTIQLIIPNVYCREIDDNKYYLSCCEDCLKEHFANLSVSPKYYFMKANKYGQYSFGYSDDEFHKICSMTVGVTQNSMIKKYGVEIGKAKWKEYCDKQAKTNTFEFKKQKYNWDKNQFDDFNKSRAVTLQNLINKYGEDNGTKKWNDYLYKQHISKSYEYMVEKYGEEKANEINKSKAITLENFIKRLGKEKGEEEFHRILNRMPKFYSNVSQRCFNKIDDILGKKYTTYYATKNTEYSVNLGDMYICLDYFIKELNICIEFNGTRFHADKRFYKDTDCPNPYNTSLTAKEIWDNDKKRYSKLLDKGIKTYIIWEADYNEQFDANNYINNILKIN